MMQFEGLSIFNRYVIMFCKSKQSEIHPTRYMMVSIDDDYDEPTIRYIQYETDLDIDMDVGFRYLGLYIPTVESP